MADRVRKGRIFGTAALLLGITSFPVFWVLHNYATTKLFFVYLAIYRALRHHLRSGLCQHGQPVL